ncbi:MYG1 family protein [Candidatus Nomurabacteria bacterium]|nr:MYG1 family protein [Candidatus Nomurabacteria bacterium]
MKTIVTHSGSFHTDDVFACAVLLSLYPEATFIRTREKDIVDKADIVFDVGGQYDPKTNRYDHHQKEGAGQRDTGIPYAAFGLIWKHFGMELCGDERVWQRLDSSLVSQIDATDNGMDFGGNKNLILVEDASMVFSKSWLEDKDEEDFFVPVKKAQEYLLRKIKVMKDDISAEDILTKIYNDSEDKRVLEIPEDLPRYIYQGVFSRLEDVLFVVYKSSSSDAYKAEAIRKDETTMESRKKFPQEWWGILDDKDERIEDLDLKGLLFCHRGGFLISADTKENVESLVKRALE